MNIKKKQKAPKTTTTTTSAVTTKTAPLRSSSFSSSESEIVKLLQLQGETGALFVSLYHYNGKYNGEIDLNKRVRFDSFSSLSSLSSTSSSSIIINKNEVQVSDDMINDAVTGLSTLWEG